MTEIRPRTGRRETVLTVITAIIGGIATLWAIYAASLLLTGGV